jgi:hypothetical protein
VTIAYAEICLAELEAWFAEAERHALAWSELGVRAGDSHATRWMEIAARCREELSRRTAAGDLRPTVMFTGTIALRRFSLIARDLAGDRWSVVEDPGRVRLSCPTWFAVIDDTSGDLHGGGNGDPRELREDLRRVADKLGAFDVAIEIDAPSLTPRQRVIRRKRKW